MKTQPTFKSSTSGLICNTNLASTDNNNCSVLAIAQSLGISYELSYFALSKHCKREHGRGVQSLKFMNLLHKIGNHVVGEKECFPHGVYEYSAPKRIGKKTGKVRAVNVRQFIEMYPSGKYIVCVNGHTFAIIDGQIIGNIKDGEKLRTEIMFAVQLKSDAKDILLNL